MAASAFAFSASRSSSPAAIPCMACSIPPGGIASEKADINPRPLAWWRCQLGRAKKRQKGTFVELTVAKPPEEPVADDPRG